MGCSGLPVVEPLVSGVDVLLFMLYVFLPCCLLIYPPIRTGGAKVSGEAFPTIGTVGGCGSNECSFRCKQGRAFSDHSYSCLQAQGLQVPTGAYRCRQAPMVAPPLQEGLRLNIRESDNF